MNQLPLSFSETLEIVAYFSALMILIGVAIQMGIILLVDKMLSLRMMFIIVLTQLLAFIATSILWLNWPMGVRILYGPILFPAAIAQLIFVPLTANFFGYRIFKKNNRVL